ncbi:DUF1559 domain-containing protein [Rubripirellula amarantea]|uniref:Putative major pilin subunit n=1 Tax=Rubripirellula amarantea TaxID=2527999 RepID=A0A5C5WN35_9BACT|nr:DUF1559 domain-containing protein [Rubripirellula amarantea]MDA8744489.1 DUF1559 domain-containing protein [Rubripirellula amarantea]TWT51202.1 putative major pilin subunit [Rubripirellula amarantea]
MQSSHSPTHCRSYTGFTLVELLVVIAIIGVLMGMAVPAMQNMRELSRRSNCQYNLAELSLAISAYDARHGHLPAGTVNDSAPIRSVAEGFHHNWISGLLETMDAQPIDQAVDRSVSVYDVKNTPVRMLRMPRLLCPSASVIRENTTCYAGIHASTETPIDETNDGVFILNRPTTTDDITDGLSYTLFVGEKLSRYEEDLGWISGTRSSLRNTGHAINAERKRLQETLASDVPTPPLYVGGLVSDHPAGVHLLLGSGEVRFGGESMDQRILEQMAAKADGALPPGN